MGHIRAQTLFHLVWDKTIMQEWYEQLTLKLVNFLRDN